MVIGLMNTRIKQFTVPAVRHLTWCLFSPALAKLENIESLQVKPSRQLLNWLDLLNTDPSHLLEYIQQNNTRLLGSYFECLMQYYFKHSPNTQLLAHHVQVNSHDSKTNARQTLGELDALTLIDGNYVHIELAIKFYLLTPNKSGRQACDWIGPQTRDRLDLKMDTLSQKQLPFLHHPETQKLLMRQGLSHCYEPALGLKGYLFKPLDVKVQLPSESSSSLASPPLMGSWIHASDIDRVLHTQGTNGRWCIINKHEWLGPFYSQEANDLLDPQQTRSAIHQHFHLPVENNSKHPYALMLVSIKDSLAGYQEQARFFVVPDGWPDMDS
jgi:hypothetical protein